MAEQSKIGWTDNTFNPWWGCQKVGAGCDNCYAEKLDARFGGGHWGAGQPRRLTGAKNWALPLKWQKQAKAEGRRIKVFCASMADVFDNAVPEEWREKLWALIEQCPDLDWQLVTKRISNVGAMVPKAWHGTWPANVWLLSTIVNQTEANRDIPKLLWYKQHYGIKIVGLSMEPLLGPVDLTWLKSGNDYIDALNGRIELGGHCGSENHSTSHKHAKLDWIIVGGESGPNARPMHPDWVRAIQAACLASGTAFFFKQWGEWICDVDRDNNDPDWRKDYTTDNKTTRILNIEGGHGFHGKRVCLMKRVTKEIAGNLLDGQKWEQFPQY